MGPECGQAIALDTLAIVGDTDGMQPTPNTRQSYPGGKAGAGVPQRLINLLPQHQVYIEPFLGHGAVLLAKRPASLNIGLDLNSQAIQIVRSRLLSTTANLDASAATSQVESLQHRQSSITGSTHHSNDDAGADFTLGHARYQLLVADGLAHLRNYKFTGNELVYCDPPYVRTTRRTKTRLYRYEMDDHQHVELLAVLRTLPCAVMISGYPNAMYEGMLHDWRTITYQATYCF
jgi:site-specific DNA-adenine methylase